MRCKIAAVTLLALSTTACVTPENHYRQFFYPAPGATPDRVAMYRAGAPPATPRIDKIDGDPREILAQYARVGFASIGESHFNSADGERDADAVSVGSSVGADIVCIINPRYKGSVSLLNSYTVPTQQTAYTNGSASTYTARGTVTTDINAVTTTYGSETRYGVSTLNQFEYLAFYLVRQKRD